MSSLFLSSTLRRPERKRQYWNSCWNLCGDAYYAGSCTCGRHSRFSVEKKVYRGEVTEYIVLCTIHFNLGLL